VVQQATLMMPTLFYVKKVKASESKTKGRKDKSCSMSNYKQHHVTKKPFSK
jgi:hypothetical protein